MAATCYLTVFAITGPSRWTASPHFRSTALSPRSLPGLGSYGLLLGAFGLGNLVGNLLSGSPRAGRHLLAVYCLSWSMVGTGFLALAAAPSLALAALAIAWAGIFTPLANVSMDTHIARVIPADRLSRVYTLQRVTVAGASALGVFAVAVVIDATSGALVIALAGTWMVLTGLLALLKIRNLPNAPPVPARHTRNRATGSRVQTRRGDAV